MSWFSDLGDTLSNAFSRDGVVTKFTARVPVVGLVTAGVQALAGNGEYAKRDLALQANSLLTAGGAAVGFAVGGPLGAIAGAAAGSSAGIGAEYGVSQTINDQAVKGNVGDVSVKRFVTEGALAGATAVIGGGGVGGVINQVGTGFSKEAGKEIIKQGAGSALKTALTTGVGSAAGYVFTFQVLLHLSYIH
jgi:hypothetical protein